MSFLRLSMLALLAPLLISPLALADEGSDLGVADPKFADFIRAVAKITAQAETKDKSAVKFICLALNSSGQVVVTSLSVGSDHGQSFTPSPGAAAIAHFHNSTMSPKPEAADFDSLRALKLPSFVVSAAGDQIWEVAIIGGSKKYRAVLESGLGEWMAF